MTPSLKEILRHRNDVCEDCREPGILVDSLTCDGDGIVVVRLPSGGGVDRPAVSGLRPRALREVRVLLLGGQRPVSKRDIKEAAEALFIIVGLLALIWVSLALDC
jgi:hypothetical protein